MSRPKFLPNEFIEEITTKRIREYEAKVGETVTLPVPVEQIVEQVLGLDFDYERKGDAARFLDNASLPLYDHAMPRGPRQFPGGYPYHVLNRAVARLPLFEKPADYAAFLPVLGETLDEFPMRILAFILMPNHWHFVLWPEHDGQLSAFCRWMTHTHSMRWHAHYHTSGTGHIYQGRFKAFPIEEDDHFYTVCRYVERNALRANLVQRTEHWRWGSLWQRVHGDNEPRCLLSPWPLPLPDDWLHYVNRPQSEAELDAVRRSVQRGTPYGSEAWQKQTADHLGLDHTLR